MAILDELEAEYKKEGLFTEKDVGVSYPLGFPILDQQLGFIQEIKLPDGKVIQQTRLGVPAGTITIFAGPSSSGKTAASIQAGYNIIEPFDEDCFMVMFDAEGSTEPSRIMELTGMDRYEYRNRVRLFTDYEQNTFEYSLNVLNAICKKKKEDKDRWMYDTGFLNIDGDPIQYYKPTVVIVDSLMKLMPSDADLDKIPGLTANGRNTIVRNFWLSNVVPLARKYNLNIIIINHLANDFGMSAPGQAPKSKQLTYMPTGKNMPGGETILSV